MILQLRRRCSMTSGLHQAGWCAGDGGVGDDAGNGGDTVSGTVNGDGTVNDGTVNTGTVNGDGGAAGVAAVLAHLLSSCLIFSVICFVF